MMAWVYLIIAGLFEIAWAVAAMPFGPPNVSPRGVLSRSGHAACVREGATAASQRRDQHDDRHPCNSIQRLFA